jgi:signal transduction histidine kinase
VKDERLGYLIKIALLFAAYFVTARIGLKLNAVSGFATLVWAPTGIALASMLILGYRFWPAILLAAFLTNFVTGAPPLVALGIGIGNTLEALAGAYLLNHFARFQHSLERVSDVFSLVVLAAFISTMVSATIGTSSLLVGGTVTLAHYPSTWLAWWVGDMLGALVVAPLLLVWSTRRRAALKLRPKRLAEASVYTVLLVGLSTLVFRGSMLIGVKPFTFAYVIFPILIWIALRFGQIGSVTATFGVSLIAIWGTIASFNPAANNSLSHNLLLLQSFMGISAVTFMTMAAAVAERERTQKQQQKLLHRAELLTKQRSRLMALNRAKDEFIGLASHQLRTPATSVKQYTGMLLENYSGKLTEAQRNMLSTAYESNERQLQVVDSILRVAQIDAGNITLKKEKVDLALLVKEILHGQTSVFATRHQTVDFTPGNSNFVATVDKEKIRMVLENILDNASKYSPPGKKLEVKLKKSKNNLAISVKDDGVGIVKRDRPKLFKKFSRIDNPLSVAVGGTGLGLYWAKKIIDLHKGSIIVTSKPNRGSTFTISLPSGRG